MFIRISDVYYKRKVQLGDDGGCHDMSVVVGLDNSIKCARMLNCLEESLQSSYVQVKKLTKRAKTTGGRSNDDR